MATPMPKGEKNYPEQKRVVVFVSIETGYLMDLLSRYQCVTKRKLHEDLFWAGVEALLGVTQDEVEESQVSPLPRGTAVPGDVKKLTQALISER